MKAYRITLEVVVKAKTKQKADKLLTRMLDAVEDELVDATAEPIEEATDDE